MEYILSAQDLRKTFTLSKKQQKLEKSTYSKKVAVNRLSFAVKKGEIFGLLGPNGAGKTTTLRMLATMIKPDEGDVMVNGFSAVDNPDEVRNQIGFLTSELKLEDFFTPNYLFDFFASLHQMPPNISDLRKRELFSKFGIDRFAEVKVKDLSTGMKQKVSIAVSLVHDPDIIIFDEPTNGLDVLSAKVVTDYLLDLRKQGKTIILSTHIFSLVERLCDRVGIIIDGKMAAYDTVETIKNGSSLEDRFFELYQNTVNEGK